MIQIELPGDLEKKLRERAIQVGQEISDLIVEAIRDKVGETSRIDSVLAPFRAAFAECGASGDELDQSVEAAREAAWQLKRES